MTIYHDEKSGLTLDTDRVENYLPSKKPKTKKEMLAYIENFDTWWDGWYGPRTYALNIRVNLYGGGIKLPRNLPDGDWFERVLEEFWLFEFPEFLADFQEKHPNYTLGQEGRSGGQLALWQKNGQYVPQRVLFDDGEQLLKAEVKERFDLLWDFADCTARMARHFAWLVYDYATTHWDELQPIEEGEEEY